ncbi:MAG: hypothetical protein KBD24_02295 [Candidatus Pacebacteria bacterium]|nr:hypothetical protein [Candidatus Paceibacterota bacterium]
MEKNTRKIVKNGRESYYVNIPKELMRELGCPSASSKRLAMTGGPSASSERV